MSGRALTASARIHNGMNEPIHKPLTKRRMLQRCAAVAVPSGAVLAAIGGWIHSHALLALGVCSLAVGLAWLVCARFTSDEPLNAAHRRYLREFFPPMGAYVLLLFCSQAMLHHLHALPLKVLAALLPVVPIVAVVRAMVRLMMASDEMVKRMQLEAISIASLSVGLLSFAAAFMHAAGLLPVDNLLMLVLPSMFAAYGLAMLWVKRRYGGE